MRDARCKIARFHELTLDELYQIINLREQVFVVEQDCPYLDVDGKDKDSIHVFIKIENKMIGYCRILPPGISYNSWSIGRVVVRPDQRRHGYGHELMASAIQWIDGQRSDQKDICISAQTYLRGFYEALGFTSTGKYYLEDNLPHMQMLRD